MIATPGPRGMGGPSTGRGRHDPIGPAREVVPGARACEGPEDSATGRVGIVVIGRNEGERLRRCLRSVVGRSDHVIYVDSGSTDDSVAFARSIGVDVIELDVSVPFTMARGRNAGLDRLLALDPGARFVQFVDGDCEFADGWLARARRFLDDRGDVAAVCGRRRERFPDRSIYNRLCDMEWDAPAGATGSCGGDVMIRVEALAEVGPFNPSMIAGEEPELCVRLRDRGWEIHRLDAEMTLHDAAMSRFGQWWRRATRAGHAYAEGAALHGRGPARHNVRAVRSILLWGLGFPAVALASLVAAAWAPAALVGLAAVVAAYALLLFRIASGRRRRGDPIRLAALYATFCVAAKWPQLIGMAIYRKNRLLRRRATLIEYKSGGERGAGSA